MKVMDVMVRCGRQQAYDLAFGDAMLIQASNELFIFSLALRYVR